MKTQYYTATSLDGFIATEDDSLDWLFPLGDVGQTPLSAQGHEPALEAAVRPASGIGVCRIALPAARA